jgi:hypothetical protein
MAGRSGVSALLRFAGLPVAGALLLATVAGAAPDDQPTPRGDGAAGGPAGGPGGAGGQAAEAGGAAAEPDAATLACLTAFSAAQRLRRVFHLLDARTQLIACGQAACPEAVVQRCTPWLREVEAAIPTIIPVMKDAHGRDSAAARVSIDGVPAAEVLDGRPVEVDPGAHTVVFQAPRQPPVTEQIVVVQAQKNRIVLARISAAPPPPEPPPQLPPPQSGSISPWTWVGFGVGGAALIAGIATGARALVEADDLEETCGGTTCSTTFQSEYDHGVLLAHVSTAMFVVAGVATAFGAAAWIWLSDPPSPSALQPVLGPGYAGLRASF